MIRFAKTADLEQVQRLRKEVNDIHLTNIAAIVITFEVEKLEISSNFKL